VSTSVAGDRLSAATVNATTTPHILRASLPTDVELVFCLGEASKRWSGAVVVVYDRVQPTAAYVFGPLWDRSIKAVTGRKVVGVAIKYRP
jgi:hypothetical protein